MPVKSFFVMALGVSILCFSCGCESDGDSGGGSGSLGGTWTGTTAGRPMTMTLQQNGTALSGSYQLSNPDFGENLTGTASGETAPATATLVGGADRRFEITFASSSSLSGAFFKGADNVGAVSATK